MLGPRQDDVRVEQMERVETCFRSLPRTKNRGRRNPRLFGLEGTKKGIRLDIHCQLQWEPGIV